MNQRLRGEAPTHITAREGQVLDLWALGLDRPRIAYNLGISVETVKNHLTHAYTKLDVHNRADAARAWLGTGAQS